MAVALLGAGITVHAQTSAKDSMRVVNLQEVQVVSTRATAKTPVAFTKQFTQATRVTALAITKLDGTAKGGVVIGISDQFKIPVRYIGVGEGIDQLQVFDRREFVDSLFGE